jgi:hypothetical protein
MPSPAYGISLTVISFLAGLAILPVFGRFSDKAKLSLAKRKIRAALYEFRLFGDEPRLVFRAQGQLLLWNARYLALVLRPAAILLIPILVLLMQMDIVYGHRALHVGESAIVTAQMTDGVDLTTASPELEGENVRVETPPVRIPDEHRALWRLRAVSTGPQSLSLLIPENDGKFDAVEKNVQVGSGLRYLSQRRVSSLFDWMFYPTERRLPASGQVRSIDIQYPDAEFSIFGFGMPWIVWFVIVSWATMFALRKRFGVVI